ncbi:GGDEF domain-containing protein [Hoeflea sp. G2-23]|uniref:diguanylate cyclase n=1 Tax=Hoeflea algicola TaxID=2983763 RepID=A0ABT3ZC85_9HYPH|nr:GGDEF domain-containing protein [Hoeflea algicola]MCY0149407.1 GGDEF domain-containing protein [Hoeflea algicola]
MARGWVITQLELDSMGKKYLARHHAANVVEGAHAQTSEELQGLLHLIKTEHLSRGGYSSLLDESNSSIFAKNSSIEALSDIIKAMSSATGDTMKEGKAAIQELVERAQEMQRVKSELEEYKRLANIDPLTGLWNRRAFDEALTGIYNDKRNVMYHALLIADIDHFKKYNDTYGHSVGDLVLKVVAAVMQSSLGGDTSIARTGGEEFAIILHDTSLEAAMETSERIRRKIESSPFRKNRSGQDFGRITMSFGLCMATDATNAEDLYYKADRALYAAKNLSRNCVKQYDPGMDAEFEKNWALYKS